MYTKTPLTIICTFIVLFISCQQASEKKKNEAHELLSPNKHIKLSVWLDNSGTPYYNVDYKNRTTAIYPSRLGLSIKNTNTDKPYDPLTSKFKVIHAATRSVDEMWTPVWGSSQIRNHFNELVLSLQHQKKDSLEMQLHFRVFNDGVGFRYVFPPQPLLNYFTLTEEHTEFNLANDYTAFWIPGDYNTNEFAYNTTPLSKIDASDPQYTQEIHAKVFYAKNSVQTPLMLQSPTTQENKLYINIHEAALENYPAMQLLVDQGKFILRSHLVPNAVGEKAYLHPPAPSPWRTIMLSDQATDIASSYLIYNLNEPSIIKETSWIRPSKYIGIWWEMHLGISTWDYEGTQVAAQNTGGGSTKVHKKKHGATTKRVKEYIDFAAKHKIDGVLVEGWNTGWADWFGNWKEDVFDFVTPYPDFDVEALYQYARRNNVKLIMHHETSASATNYERQLDTAFRFMKKYGYDVVKTGYVGRIIPRGEYHAGEWMVRHFSRVAQKAADYRIMINSHEAVRPTGLSRKYPNWLASESARGMEYNAWSEGNKPEHETILAFTRLLGGPMDYTPGIVELELKNINPNKSEIIHTTLAKQLALYVVIPSPIQMAADLPESYEKYLDAFQFIKDVAVDWHSSKYLYAAPGDYVVVTRKAKQSQDWFVGAITDENNREFDIHLDFLDEGKVYQATIYSDGEKAHWKNNPQSYAISSQRVTNQTTLKVNLAEGGGCAIKISPL